MNRAEKRRQKKLAKKAARKAKLGKATIRSPGQQTLTIQESIDFALQHHAAGRLPEAESIYQQILQADPNQPAALHLLGMIAHQVGKHDTAVDLIKKAIAIKPDSAKAHGNLGIAFKELGRLDEAVASYHKALAIKPDFPEAHYNLGNAFKELGRLDEAVASYHKALAIKPDYADAHNNLGIALRELGRLDETVTSYQKVLAIKPDYAEAHYNLGNAFKDLGRLDEAVASYHKALAIKPDYPKAHSNLGNAFKELGRLDEAVASYQKVLAIKPDYAEAHNNLGVALQELGRLDEAVASYHKALAIKPDYADVHNNLGLALQDLGKLDEAVASYHKALAIKPDYAGAHSNRVFAEQYKVGVTLKKLNDVHAEWDKRHGVPLQTEWRDHDNIPDPDRTLRIGFVSPNLGRHPVGYFVVKLLEHRQARKIEIICYSDRRPDDITDRLMALSDEWTDVRGISDEDLSQRIRSDRIDILIDLAGHTAKNRLLVIARKPAPIQVKWVGYAGSVGLSTIDYLIADYRHVPEGTERHYTEEVIRLPDGYVSYEPPDYAPEVGPLPFEHSGFITFGSFNNPAKINDDVLAAWAEILKAVPNSRLLLKYRNMDAEGNRNRILEQFGAHGVEESRLTLEGKSPHPALLGRYNDVDIALDTFPYTGGLTTCEALWMGVPAITKPGETFASRHSLSHLTNVGVPELVADDLPDYVSKAVELANDVPRLTGLRSGLRERMAASPLCDGEKFATDFTSAMQNVWQEWCLSQDGGGDASL